MLVAAAAADNDEKSKRIDCRQLSSTRLGLELFEALKRATKRRRRRRSDLATSAAAAVVAS